MSRMHKIPVFCLLFLVLIVIGECIELPGGKSISVSGQDSAGSASGQPPVFSYPGVSFSAGHPSNYVVPAVKIPPSPSSSESKESSQGSNLAGTTSNQVLGFTMMSDVSGTGKFATWSCLGGQKYMNKAHELMSAISGDLTQSSQLSYSVDRESNVETDSVTFGYALAKIDKRDSILFVGQSYNDITELHNNNDLLQDDIIRAGAVSRTSVYSSQSLKVNIEDEINNTELVNNYIVYNTGSRFVGSSNLHAITNGTEIDQFYSGQYALNRTIVSQLRFSNITTANSWLDCCLGGYLTMPNNYQMGSNGFGSDLRTLFDCTKCPALPPSEERQAESGIAPVKVGKY